LEFGYTFFYHETLILIISNKLKFQKMKKLFIAAIFLAGFAGASFAQAPERTKTKTAVAKNTTPTIKSMGTQTGGAKTSTPTKTTTVNGKEKREAKKPKMEGTTTKQKRKTTGIGGKKRHKARKKAKKAK
jgi:hypothetical protein